MNQPAPLLFTVFLSGGIFFCLLAGPAAGLAQTPPSVSLPAASLEQPAASPETPADATPAATNDTDIYAQQGATFGAKDRIAVFNGDVRVRDSRFNLDCAKLTAYLNKGSAGGVAPSPAPTPPPVSSPAAKAGDPDHDSGIDHAVAEGQVIIIQKRASTKAGEEEKVTIAHCDRAEYDSKTGDMTLRGMPKVEQNGDSHEALSSSTYMILHRDNSLETHGPSRTHIVQRAKDNPPGTKPGSSPPAGSPSGRRATTSGTQN